MLFSANLQPNVPKMHKKLPHAQFSLGTWGDFVNLSSEFMRSS
jgi:hypothetical protein